MPTGCSTDLFAFAPVEGRRVEASFDAGLATSDAGALLLGATDKAIGLIARFSECFEDSRAAGLIEHEVKTLVGQRIVEIALGYEDLSDHDHLRRDPVVAVLAGKRAPKRLERNFSNSRKKSSSLSVSMVQVAANQNTKSLSNRSKNQSSYCLSSFEGSVNHLTGGRIAF